MKIFSIILAAGEGKRMKSNIPKPLHQANGKPLIDWVSDAVTKAGSTQNIYVIGHLADKMQEHLGGDAKTVLQKEQLGTGHAVMQGIKPMENETGTVIVMCGDTPLITAETLKNAINKHINENASATVITSICDNPYGYGRIVRKDGSVAKIVEQKDATPEEAAICEINSGMYIFDIQKLKSVLSEITSNNSQNEYYLTDAVELLIAKGETVTACLANFDEIMGVNDRVQLSLADSLLCKRYVTALMESGVSVLNPESVRIGADVKVGTDTIIYPGTILEGNTEIGENCIIGPNTRIKNCKIGNGTEMNQTVALDSTVGDNTCVGPFAYIRPNSKIGNNIKVGDFVEVKNATIGNGTKIAHLTYVGDADVGKRVNFGCGTVVVNYDGVNKHRTIIEDDCFIGCNTNLVSPVTVKKGAYTAAGSTVTDEVPEDALAIARSRQVIKEDWVKKNRK